ncbi:unnamed protein product [Blepharisma stoltei]|uniref:Metaxin glutathione S-transferase domain-containing protein n=1 Tax=Blepharisma stoltei TaxID=1481888 RepID=A0AAU9II00_9CILI|nr:unnamed protein product [Blepharisma stoltei]
MEDIVLYTYGNTYDPVTQIAKLWHSLYELENFQELHSDYYWNGLGDLPILRFNKSFFTNDHILPFLKIAFDCNFDFSEEERLESDLIEEQCISKLHPATTYAKWMEEDTSKNFFYSRGNFFWRLLKLPFEKLSFISEKRHIREYLLRQHNITNRRDCYYQAEKAHELLSQKLGEKPFFFSKPGRREFPRSTDIVVYAYLMEELNHIGDHFNVKDSLSKYENLLGFLKRMDKVISMKSTEDGNINYTLVYSYFLQPPSECKEEYFPPKIYFNVLKRPEKFWYTLKYQSGEKKNYEEKTVAKDIIANRYWNAGAALTFILFLAIRTK